MQDDFFVKKGEPPAPSAGEAAASSSAPASGGAGAGMGSAVAIGGIAVAAGLGAVALSGLSTADSGVDCGAAPQGFGGAWFAQYSEWCSCMGGTASTANGVECIR